MCLCEYACLSVCFCIAVHSSVFFFFFFLSKLEHIKLCACDDVMCDAGLICPVSASLDVAGSVRAMVSRANWHGKSLG